MNEDDLYEQAMIDVEAGNVEAGMWAKAFALADGEPNKTKAKYIRLWVQSKLSLDSNNPVLRSTESAQPKSAQDAKQRVHSCPKCDSEDWKLCSVTFAAGVASTKGSSSSLALETGIGKRGGVGIVFAGSDFSATHQSELARMAARPAKPYRTLQWLERELHATKKELEKYLASPNATAEPIFFLGMRIPGHPGTRIQGEIDRVKALIAQHEYHEDWPITRMCMRCGTRYIPGKQSPEERVEALFSYGPPESIEEEDAREDAYRKSIGLS